MGNSVNEAYVGLAKRTIVKMLCGKGEFWCLYLNYAQYCLNVRYARLHKSRPYAVLFNRQPNEFQDYTKVTSTLKIEKAKNKIIDEKYKFIQEVLIPALSERIKETQKRDHERFSKIHKIVEQQFPIRRPFFIYGIMKNDSYILKDKTGTLLSRDVPTSHIVYKAMANVTPDEFKKLKDDHYEIQAVIDHRGTYGNYKYRVRWKGYPNTSDDIWEPVEHFDSIKHIELY
ncbi:hypothetical protein EC973_006482 [Apophysomyces ossiformis]|uniref:Chromo domain-containing protein n=1 Tax=Apophysomyces ossiformis TaxID=679940 RepID=A0A8H7BEM0_9FUNG|nr:hypothetical protein EC973_006482 [Apophysomyces ossiformis]